MKKHIYRLALEGDQWTYYNSPLEEVLEQAKKLSRFTPSRDVLIQKVEIRNPQDCFLVKCGIIQKGGRICSTNQGV